jgi:AraC family L-rhamnose operon regulatory protein RhaS
LHVPSAKDIEHGVSSKFPAPIYEIGSKHYEIDTCAPQIQAAREGKIEMHALSKGHYPGKRMKSNILPGLANIGLWNCRRVQDWGLDFHRNEGLEVVFLETGSTVFEVDGRTHPLQAGHLTVTRPWQLHRLGAPHIGRGRLHWLILDVGVRRPNQPWRWPEWVVLESRDLADLTRKLRHGEQSVWQANPNIRETFREIGQCVTGWSETRMPSRLAVAVNRLLLELLDVLTLQQSVESPELASRRRTVELFLRDLAGNPASCATPWTLEAMARRCGMGITAFSRYFHELVNSGPVAYLNQCRLDHAARILRLHPRRSITSVAMECGFNSSQYFATCFRHRHRMTPQAYRARRDA